MTLPGPPPAVRRLFVAVNLEPALRERIWGAAEPLRVALGRRVGWTAAANLHLTLRFLGEQPAGRVAAAGEAVRAAATGLDPFALEIVGAGAFPSLARPRVLWLGIEANSALALLYKKVDDQLAAVGFGREGRAFHPHLTLGRVRPGVRIAPGELADASARLVERFRSPVASVELMASELAPGGSRYTVVHAARLQR